MQVTKRSCRFWRKSSVRSRSEYSARAALDRRSSRGLLRAGVQLLLNKAGEILKPLKGRGGKLTWTGVDQAQRAKATVRTPCCGMRKRSRPDASDCTKYSYVIDAHAG